MSKKSPRKRTIKRPPNKYKKESEVVRLSPEVIAFIKETGHRGEAIDNILRRIVGMPANKYAQESAKTFFVVAAELFLDESEALGAAVRLAVKQGKKTPPQVLKLREVI
jgi:hypothetical protein